LFLPQAKSNATSSTTFNPPSEQDHSKKHELGPDGEVIARHSFLQNQTIQSDPHLKEGARLLGNKQCGGGGGAF